MGEALDRGMVLVLSLWDDTRSAMRWLDSEDPLTLPDAIPGVLRGPCDPSRGEASAVEASSPSAFVKYTNIRYGDIGSTHPGLPSNKVAAPANQPPPVVPALYAQKAEALSEALPEADTAPAWKARALGPAAASAGALLAMLALAAALAKGGRLWAAPPAPRASEEVVRGLLTARASLAADHAADAP